MKKLLIAAVAACTWAALTVAQAHGPAEPKHGGIARSASDLGFELVVLPDGAALYLDDHDKPLPTQGTSGKLSVLNGATKSEAELKPAGANKLEAKGIQLQPGAKVVATVTLPDKKVVTVRFAVPAKK